MTNVLKKRKRSQRLFFQKEIQSFMNLNKYIEISEKEFEIREGRPATTSGIVGNGALGSVLPAVVLSMLLLLGRALTESESCASTFLLLL